MAVAAAAGAPAPRPSMGPARIAARGDVSRPQACRCPTGRRLAAVVFASEQAERRPGAAPTPRPSMGISRPSAPAGNRSRARPSHKGRRRRRCRKPAQSWKREPSLRSQHPGIATSPGPALATARWAIGRALAATGREPATAWHRPELAGNCRAGPRNRPGTGDRPVIGRAVTVRCSAIVPSSAAETTSADHRRRQQHRQPPRSAITTSSTSTIVPAGDSARRRGHGHWADHWYDHHVPPHYHGWYHGCWSGNWGRYWYAPLVAGATAWGLNALLPSWGYAYGYTYANPYYVASAAPVYDYSQPIVINTYNVPTADASADSGYGRKPRLAAARNRRRRPKPISFSTRRWRPSRTATTRVLCSLTSKPCGSRRKTRQCTKSSALCMFALGDYTGRRPS